MTKELLQAVIESGASDNRLIDFFYDVSTSFRPIGGNAILQDERFPQAHFLGEINFSPVEKLALVTAQVANDLSDRSGKKAQYDYAKKLLKTLVAYDGGIFVFRGAKKQFRFSLIYTQYQGKKRDFSNFRRFTYFVGPAQTNNTFRERVGKGVYSSLDAIKDAFSVEKVNKEFYKQIAQYYYRLTGKDSKLRELDLPDNGSTNGKLLEEFSVRLIGRIIFCWFLKHKHSPANLPLIPGDVLSSNAVIEHYYHSTLERLFFEVLNTPIADRKRELVSFIAKHDEIPFLNGGLFEPHTDDYYKDSANWALRIPDKWFRDFFELLEQYNFTIDENSTVDAEVSVDPEMMGRIFENLLAEVNPETGETARKTTGSYYTPRVIVDYMVEQSLKQYLLTKTDINAGLIDDLISYERQIDGWQAADKESVVKAFKEIRILDPACGSGAFPLGILHRMILGLEKVDPELTIWRKDFLNGLDEVVKKTVEKNISKSNWAYIRKLMIIRDSIYGVDIQPIAVEIAKLRCFLSLVVDEIVVDSEMNRGIEALPNLEFKFVAANSLCGLPPAINRQVGLEVDNTVTRLKEIREIYLRSFGDEKKKLERDFLTTRAKLVEQNINWGGKDALALQIASWNPFSYEASSWFEPEWMFGVTGGFDVVIANPPYIRQEKLKDIKPELKQQFSCYEGTADIYVYFYERGVRLLKNRGTLTFISSNKYFRAGYGASLRKFLVTNTRILKIIDFGDTPVFEATAYPSIIIVQKALPEENRTRTFSWSPEMPLEEFSSIIESNGSSLLQKDLSICGWQLESPTALKLLAKLRDGGIPLTEYVNGRFYRGILTGLNEAFVIDKSIRDRLIAAHSSSAQVLKPFLRGKDIKRWTVKFAEQYLIKIECSENQHHPWSGKSATEAERIFAKNYPAIHRWFEPFRDDLIKRADQGKYFWELRSCKYWQEYEQANIVWGNLATEPKFALSHAGRYVSAPANTIVSESNYLLGILNSKVTRYLVSQSAAERQGGYLEYKPMNISLLAIPDPPKNEGISNLVREILLAKTTNPEADVSKIEHQIDEIVYDLYGLTEEEVAVVEGKAKP